MRGVSLYGAAAAAVVAMVLLTLAFIWRAEDQARLEEGRYANCVAIEELKAHERAEAWDRWRNLDRTLRLLGLERTPAIEAAAREQRDNTLRRFAASEC